MGVAMLSRAKTLAVTVLPAAYSLVLFTFLLSPFTALNPSFTLLKVTPELNEKNVYLAVYFQSNAYPVVVEVYSGDTLLGKEAVLSGNRASIPLTAPLLIPGKITVRVVVYAAGDKVADEVYTFSSRLVYSKPQLDVVPGLEGLRVKSVTIQVTNYGSLPAAVSLDQIRVSLDGEPIDIGRGYKLVPASGTLNITGTIDSLIPVSKLLVNHSVEVSTPAGVDRVVIPAVNITASIIQVVEENNRTGSVVVEIENRWKYPFYISWLKLLCDGEEAPFKSDTFFAAPGSRTVASLTLTQKCSCKVVAIYFGDKFLAEGKP